MDDGPVPRRWWEVRTAQSLQPKSYVCPLCDQYLHATSEHMLLMPEGDASRRRHAHTECVARARQAGELPSRDEWRSAARTPTPPRRHRFGRR